MPKVVLLILDGWGRGKPYRGNAVSLAGRNFVESLGQKYPLAFLETSGENVGLPAGQMGNSEVGHLNIGAGRVVYQQLGLINKAFAEGKVAQNAVLNQAFDYAAQHKKNVHFIGLLSDGGVHSHINHLIGLSYIAGSRNIPAFVHAFTDGRDTDPKSGLGFLQTLQQAIAGSSVKLASVIGRYYAMDRDKRWERVQKAYNLMVNGTGEPVHDVKETIQACYIQNITDEFMPPLVLTDSNNAPVATIAEGDVVININFRTDRGREITQVLTQQDFPEYGMKHLSLRYITMTEYDNTYTGVETLFENEDLRMTLGEVLANAGKTQVRIAETEKYPHVTFFFSGGRETPFDGEKRYLCPSPKVATYDLQPEMSAEEVKLATLKAITNDKADLIVTNFANPDMVGHTGVLPAVIKAIEKVDECVEEIVSTALANQYTLLITADHGNSEYMINEDGSPNTAHTTNQVPLWIVSNQTHHLQNGKLADLAPTVLHLLGMVQPAEMDGVNLVH